MKASRSFKKNRKSYNPFKMWGSWVSAIIFIISPPFLFLGLPLLETTSQLTLDLIGDLISGVLGFFVGWGIYWGGLPEFSEVGIID